MKFTLSWLKEHLETKESLANLMHHLTMLGIEVESCDDPSARLAPFLIAEIRSLERHPNADRLNVCQVQVDKDPSKPLIQVVCGAPNVYEGMKTVFAHVGTHVPGLDIVLKPGNIRGVDSHGMMCSKSELNLGVDSEGILDLPIDAPVGVSFAKVYGYDDPIVEVGITPNRADCFGIKGIAQDLAAAKLGKYKPRNISVIKGEEPCEINVEIEDKALCPAYMGRMISNITNVESPEWLQQRLRNIGLEPISAVVDVTNYINYDLCRPLHAFDADTLRGNLSVRKAKTDEQFVGLNDTEYKLSNSHLVIADENGAVAIAGVLGGKDSGTSMETTSVFLESALFSPEAVMQSGRDLNIHTDSRLRFERGVDPESVKQGLELATHMIMTICGGEASDIVSAGVVPSNRKKISVSMERIQQVTGIKIEILEVEKYLAGLGFTDIQHVGNFALSAMTPTWRFDISEEHDVIEEILRLRGYDSLPNVSMMTLPGFNAHTFKQSVRYRAKKALVCLGFDECVHYSFLDKAVAEKFNSEQNLIEVANPISQKLSHMRPTVLASLLSSVQQNIAYSYTDLAIFEVGNVYKWISEKPEQEVMVSGVVTGLKRDQNWDLPESEYNVFDIKSAVFNLLSELGLLPTSFQIDSEAAPAWYHPGQSVALKLGPKNTLGYFGRIHPETEKLMEIDQPVFGFELFLDKMPTKPVKYKPYKLNALQPVYRDFAFLVDKEVPAGKLIKAVEGVDKQLISKVRVFDVYTGKGVGENQKSVALNVTLTPKNKTLEDSELQEVSAKIIAAVAKLTGGELRGSA